ncbi:hypothetical protein EMCRGX_G023027 [Ephydatia muelleri]
MARRAARREKDCCASVPQHPYDSTARGMHTHPSSAHFESLALCFSPHAATRAEDPHLTLASVKVIGLSGEVIDESAACQDQDHFQLQPDLLSKPYDRTPQNITKAVVTQDHITPVFARQCMVTKQVQPVVRTIGTA